MLQNISLQHNRPEKQRRVKLTHLGDKFLSSPSFTYLILQGIDAMDQKKHLFFLLFSIVLLLLLPIKSSLGDFGSTPVETGINVSAVEQNSSPSLLIKVFDALSNAPISNATVIIWNLNVPEKPKVGAGIYFTDKNGLCVVSGEYLQIGHIYRVYAYKGNFERNIVEYVPAKCERDIVMSGGSVNISLALVPGALISLEGAVYIVQSSTPEERYIAVKVILDKPLNYSFISEYGASPDAFYLGLSKRIVIVPSRVPFKLEAEVFYFSKERIAIEKETFYIDNNSLPFIMNQGSTLSIKLPAYSLRRSLEYVKSLWLKASSTIDEAQKVGFTVFSERRMLTGIAGEITEAESLLLRASTKEDFEKIWLTLRKSFGELSFISMVIQMKYLVGKTNAVYLSGVMAVFSVVLGSFFFEDNKRKLALSILFYIAFIAILYITHPGAHVIIGENLNIFLQSAVISLAAVLIIVFGVPRVWKERNIEGEVSWRSALSIIFSMSKRQIRRKGIRNALVILSVCVFILAFTSLTSVGTVYGVVSERVNASPPSNGILINRLDPSSNVFLPLGSGDADTLSKIISAYNVTVRLKNLPSSKPIVRITNPKTNDNWLIYGVLAISPTKESTYTKIHETVTEGEYLSEDGFYEIIVESSVAEKLNVKVNSNVTLEVIGTGITVNAIVKGVMSREKYNGLTDLDGKPLGPIRFLADGSVRRCNSTETAIINLKTAEEIQKLIDARYILQAPRFVVPSEIVFQVGKGENIENIAKSIILFFGYNVFVASGNSITYYHIGSYLEVKGFAEIIIPLVMVVLNISMVMVNSLYERRGEIKILSMLGLNPTHIRLIFLAEATIIGMVGGSVGYMSGLSFYRLITLLGQDLVVREKLEWWWSALGFTLAIIISLISAVRPASLAVRMYTPSKVEKLKVTEKERIARKEEIFRAYQARELSMPVKLLPGEKDFFINYFLSSLKELSTSLIERVENIEILPEIEDSRGRLITAIKFNYCVGPPEKRVRIRNTVTVVKSPDEEYYRVRLSSEPEVPGIPESMMERVVDYVNDVIMYWVRNKDKIIGGKV
jgi:ABC-type antimicrobial peptide transport system permease subunit